MEETEEEVNYDEENSDIQTDDFQDYRDIVIEIDDKILQLLSSFNIG